MLMRERTVTSLIKDVLETWNLKGENRVGIGSDGASVMVKNLN